MTNENCKIIFIKWKMLMYGFSRNNVCSNKLRPRMKTQSNKNMNGHADKSVLFKSGIGILKFCVEK